MFNLVYRSLPNFLVEIINHSHIIIPLAPVIRMFLMILTKRVSVLQAVQGRLDQLAQLVVAQLLSVVHLVHPVWHVWQHQAPPPHHRLGA